MSERNQSQQTNWIRGYGALFVCAAVLVGCILLSSRTEASSRSSENYQISRDSLNSGGIDFAESENYQLSDTAGEVGTGRSSSENYNLQAGYRQLDEATISVTVPPAIDLPTINGISGGAGEAVGPINVTTDNPSGYSLYVRATSSPALINQTQAGNIADYNAGVSPDYAFTIANDESAFAFSPEGDDISSAYRDNGTACSTGSMDTTGACWNGFTTTNELIAQSNDNNQPDGTATNLRLRTEIGADRDQLAGNYQATVVVTAIAD